ncbi:hypothetical protein C9I57_12900 [Trinickia symbiotica]|uniref:Glycosyltransferase 2-like domain-containing protein n=1 Tax=Trinickia symbiotica TaxID=863227 RepID=A0A2T3XW33_9BURK|nr:glycosyltransferase [Trinickia symbiotica]PTB20711.1 hypothetical protein C9I57_12900 [Trinickia symbiotica]
MSKSAVMNIRRVDFSVVVPCHNEAAYIGNLLHDLTKQTIGLQQFEVILVDNSSSDATSEVIWEFARGHKELNVRLVHEYRMGVSRARNAGAAAAKGTTLVFLDADNRVSPTFLSGLSHHMHEKDSVAGTIRTLPDIADVRAFFVFWTLELIKMLLRRPFGKSYVHKSLYKDSGGYNERVALGENVEFLVRVKSLAKRNGRVFGHIRRPIYCSLRRFHKQGYFRILLPWLVAYCGFFSLQYQTMTSIEGRDPA